MRRIYNHYAIASSTTSWCAWLNDWDRGGHWEELRGLCKILLTEWRCDRRIKVLLCGLRDGLTSRYDYKRGQADDASGDRPQR
jgi:hypothetical protein